jgi:hypothetical protein
MSPVESSPINSRHDATAGAERQRQLTTLRTVCGAWSKGLPPPPARSSLLVSILLTLKIIEIIFIYIIRPVASL